MAELNKIATNIDEAGPLMSERGLVDGDDWRVKIMRRASPAAGQETVAIFDGATAEQLLSPEPWLSKFAGGSQFYSFRVVHAKDRASDRPTAIYTLPAIPGAPLNPNVKIVGGPGWNGPSTIMYPDEASMKSNGATKWPTSPESLTGAPRQPAAPSADGSGGPSLLAEVARERAALAEERHRMEMDAIRRENESDRKRLEGRIAEIAAKLDRPVVMEPRTDPMDTIAKVIGAIAAAFAPVIPLIVASRQETSKREEARLVREADREAKREEREAHLMEKIATQSSESAKVIGVFTESLSTVARSMVQTVAMVGELRQVEQPDEGIMGVLKAGISAWAESQARAPAPMMQPALAPQAQPPRQPPAQPAPTSTTNGQPSQFEEPEAAGTEEREVSPGEMLDIMATEIREKTPEEDLAGGIVDALQAQEFVEALVSEGGALASLQKRLGAEWAQDQGNVAYIQRLFTRVGQIASSKNVSVQPLFPTAQ